MNETHPRIEQIVEYLHGELPPAQDAAMHAHLAACASCESLRAEEAALTEALRAAAAAQERELPAGVIARIRERAAAPRSKAAWFVWVPAAAALAALFYVGLHHATPAPVAIRASTYVEDHTAMAASAPFADDAPPVTMTSDDETH